MFSFGLFKKKWNFSNFINFASKNFGDYWYQNLKHNILQFWNIFGSKKQKSDFRIEKKSIKFCFVFYRSNMIWVTCKIALSV